MDKVPAEGPGGGTGIMGLSVAGERDRSAKRALRRRGGARSKRSVGKSFFSLVRGLLYRADNL